ncbi:unnamed protein product [Caenorhabditis auriculariae]|uniref:Fatty acyl-CoA reductase n=1 Tax=Caenorhabditis auriculariae TaxID=2777116 RepID=A0A8S1HIN0_9PELO|nr:unnamed protein product [Caenorhabditis auriculariae]
MAFRVGEVYAGSSVFLTGGTGFLGKVVIEKLLWSVDDIGNIYMLIRPQKGKSPEERLQTLLKDPLYERLHKHKPKALKKLIPVAGEMMQENLGMSHHDLNLLCNEVSIVIHSAATVKFDEQLRIATEMNVLGTSRIIALCHRMAKLKSIVHVSTAYANCDRPETEEKIYPPPIPPQQFF